MQCGRVTAAGARRRQSLPRGPSRAAGDARDPPRHRDVATRVTNSFPRGRSGHRRSWRPGPRKIRWPRSTPRRCTRGRGSRPSRRRRTRCRCCSGRRSWRRRRCGSGWRPSGSRSGPRPRTRRTCRPCRCRGPCHRTCPRPCTDRRGNSRRRCRHRPHSRADRAHRTPGIAHSGRRSPRGCRSCRGSRPDRRRRRPRSRTARTPTRPRRRLRPRPGHRSSVCRWCRSWRRCCRCTGPRCPRTGCPRRCTCRGSSTRRPHTAGSRSTAGRRRRRPCTGSPRRR